MCCSTNPGLLPAGFLNPGFPPSHVLDRFVNPSTSTRIGCTFFHAREICSVVGVPLPPVPYQSGPQNGTEWPGAIDSAFREVRSDNGERLQLRCGNYAAGWLGGTNAPSATF